MDSTKLLADTVLEPGGLLQWDERDPNIAVKNNGASEKEAMQTLLDTTDKLFKMLDVSYALLFRPPQQLTRT